MTNSSEDKCKKIKNFMMIISFSILVIFGALDRLTKLYAVKRLKDHPNLAVIPGKIEFHYLENRGAAFGLLKGEEAFFIFVSIVIFLSIVYVLYKVPAKRKYYPVVIFLSFIATGAVENMFDRVIYHYVIDFIFISLVRFPIFNIADLYVSFSSFILILLLLFKYREEDLNFLRFKENKLREI